MTGKRLFACCLMLVLFVGCWNPMRRKEEKISNEMRGKVPETLMADGYALLERGRTEKARRNFEEVLLRPDAGPFQVDATLAIADSYFADGSRLALTDAMSHYTTFLAFYATHAKADYAQYQIGMCYYLQMGRVDRDMGPTRDAIKAFKKLLNTFPGSEYEDDAMAKITECETLLARHELYVGDFYFDRDSFPAAAARYDFVLETWLAPDVREPALAKAAEAHFRAKEDEKSKIRFNKLLSEFPSSNFAQLAVKRLEMIAQREQGESFSDDEMKDLSKFGKDDGSYKPEKDKKWWQFWK